jgi:hypothetical protein
MWQSSCARERARKMLTERATDDAHFPGAPTGAQLDCFAIGERSDAVLTNGYGSQ